MSDEKRPVKILSTGQPSTLGTWHSMCQAFFGPESKATAFIKKKLDEQGADMAVLADESQLLIALIQLARDDARP